MKLFLFACLSGFSVILAQERLEKIEPIIAESAIQLLGFRTVETSRHEQSKQEIARFGKAEVKWQSIRALKQADGSNSVYYRFRIEEESFATANEAKRRIQGIKDMISRFDPKKESEWLPCDGIVIGKHAYIVSTDSEKSKVEALRPIMTFLASDFEKAIHKREEFDSLMNKMGVRFGKKGDVPFVASSMRVRGQDELQTLLQVLKEADIHLSGPDEIDEGMGVWKIAPDDYDRAWDILNRKQLKETLRNLEFYSPPQTSK